MKIKNLKINGFGKLKDKNIEFEDSINVIYGKNDWLYYSSTLDDYSGRNKLSERELFNLAYNLSIVQDYLQKQDIKFVFTVPANKNTLYGENMPYYYIASDVEEHNAKQLEKHLEKQNINYILPWIRV